ncbi:MAG: ytsJ [Bacillota bacterium]|jgi:malate dehydrogenase (oxaloacetate-decarboxylating)|nr:ytsJ [Bacillota bacterium]
MGNVYEESLKLHKELKGKISVEGKVCVNSKEALSLAYTPGVAEPCLQIHEEPDSVYDYTSKGNMVAVVSDGTAVLGLGDIGPLAAIPVMEGKAVLFKQFGGVNAFPICLNTKNTDEIINAVKMLEPVFGGINLEDISAPRCFEIENRLIEEMSIPVFHDDQHGTAVVVLAGLINALKIVNKKAEKVEIIINGAGSAGIAITKLLLKYGFKNIIICDRTGAIYKGREKMNQIKSSMAEITNLKSKKGSLQEVIENTDVFIGVSSADMLSGDMVKNMNTDAIIFALANPKPEIMPEEAKLAGARVVGTGRSDFANQINNVLAFPGIFRGALDIRASRINDEMKIAAAKAIASLIDENELNEEYILPKPFDERICKAVSEAVVESAIKTGVSRIKKC